MKQDKKDQSKSEAVVEKEIQSTDESMAGVVGEEQRKIQELQLLLAASLEREKRVLADYQNLQRRSQEERMNFIRMANKDFCEVLLAPLEHLSMAASNLKDRGLDMVIEQFWKELKNFGLAEIEVLGQKFDLKTMEVVDKKGEGEEVVGVVRKGYTLNGEVIQHSQVILA